jgi:hypothetical protein
MCVMFSPWRFEITILGYTFQRSNEAGTILLTQFKVVLFLFKCNVSKTNSETQSISELNLTSSNIYS